MEFKRSHLLKKRFALIARESLIRRGGGVGMLQSHEICVNLRYVLAILVLSKRQIAGKNHTILSRNNQINRGSAALIISFEFEITLGKKHSLFRLLFVKS